MINSIGVAPSTVSVCFSCGALADTRLWITLLIGWKAARQICDWMREHRAADACVGERTRRRLDRSEEQWTMHHVLQEKVQRLESKLNSLFQACEDFPMSSGDHHSLSGTVQGDGREKSYTFEIGAANQLATERDGQITWERYALMEEIEIARLREENTQLGLLNEKLAIENKELSRRILHIAFDEGEKNEALSSNNAPKAAEYAAYKTPEKSESCLQRLAKGLIMPEHE